MVDFDMKRVSRATCLSYLFGLVLVSSVSLMYSFVTDTGGSWKLTRLRLNAGESNDKSSMLSCRSLRFNMLADGLAVEDGKRFENTKNSFCWTGVDV